MSEAAHVASIDLIQVSRLTVSFSSSTWTGGSVTVQWHVRETRSDCGVSRCLHTQRRGREQFPICEYLYTCRHRDPPSRSASHPSMSTHYTCDCHRHCLHETQPAATLSNGEVNVRGATTCETHPFEHVFHARCGNDSAIDLTTKRPPPPESHRHVNVILYLRMHTH